MSAFVGELALIMPPDSMIRPEFIRGESNEFFRMKQTGQGDISLECDTSMEKGCKAATIQAKSFGICQGGLNK